MCRFKSEYHRIAGGKLTWQMECEEVWISCVGFMCLVQVARISRVQVVAIARDSIKHHELLKIEPEP